MNVSWTTTQEKTPMSRSNSPDGTERLNAALNTVLIKNKLNKIRYTQDSNTMTIHNKHNGAELG